MNQGNLQDQGFRFIWRESYGFGWKHPAEVLPRDLDCTDMSDDTFAMVVEVAA